MSECEMSPHDSDTSQSYSVECSNHSIEDTEFTEVQTEPTQSLFEFTATNDEPFIGQEFDELDAVYNFYNSYAKKMGFGIRKNSSAKSQVTKQLIWKNYVCDKSGKKNIRQDVEVNFIRRRRDSNKHLVENIYEMRNSQSDFYKDYKIWYYCKTQALSESKWNELLHKYGLENNTWLVRMWERRHHWVPAFFNDVFVAGMTSTGRSESINAFFDGFVNANTHLYEFVKQYERALETRRHSEELEDFQTLNTTATLISNTTIEAHAGQCFTKVMFKLFQCEYKQSLECWHQKLSTIGTVKCYLVGLSSEEKYKWCNVSYDLTDLAAVRCDCAKFETDGILCKHILHMMCKNQVSQLPEKFMLKRWTINARNILTYASSTSTNSEIVQVTPIMKWTLASMCNKLVEKISKHESDFREFYSLVADRLDQFENAHGKSMNSSMGSQMASNLIPSNIPTITIRDPLQVRRKGRPKVASRISSGIELSQTNIKKRTCGLCGDKEHYMTTCPKKNKDKMID